MKMNPLPILPEQLDALPSYWKSEIRLLSSRCDAERAPLTLRTLLFALRDMPYERPEGQSNDAQACISQWRGTCSAKHLAAYELLDSLGLSPKLWLASYRIDFQRAYYSDLLRSQATGLVVYDIHNYITCTINGRSTIVDITFPAALGDYGFPVTTSWLEGRDFALCCAPDEVREIRSIDQADHMKRQWLQALNRGDAAIIRESAIQELILSAKQA